MAGSSFGTLFKFTSWGESHGPAIGCVVDGTPPRLPVSEADIQVWLDKRRPGQSRFVTQRQEPDTVKILSGVFEGVTTGTPIALHIDNVDQRSRDYSEIKDKFRPAHADYTYFKKYGVRDYRGGGRQSARETAVRVAAGAIARKILATCLGDGVKVRGAVVQLGTQKIDRSKWDWDATGDNPFWCPDRQAGQAWEGYLDDVRKRGSSCGAIIEVVASGIPVGLGDPVYDKLDADLAKGLMSINAVKGVEIGDGFAVAAMSGEQDADEMRMKDGQPVFLSNHAGGILGGISSGQDIVCRLVVKPTSSILHPVRSIDRFGNEVELRTTGRHDPCVGIRATPVAEAMVAVVLADHLLRHRAQNG
jgi:chorismate synthase